MEGARIIAARKARGMSQQDLANALETSQATIHRYETEDRDPKSGVVVKLAAALGVTVSYLLGATDDMGIEPDKPKDQRLSEIVDIYNSMSNTGREALLATARGLANSYSKSEDTNCIERSA